ncbi:MAG: rRNA maturation RNase YbeY [Ruminococcaceae bacterium]|nr:rRNA maturation RNase YbeY [Oscillospiraceae bacterium]
MKVTYYITNEQEKIEFLPEYEELIKKAVEGTLAYEGIDRNCEISVTFTDNESIRELNREYRDIDRETDVLSFPMEDMDELDGDGDVVLGDVVISLEKAKEQAEEYGHSLEREISFLCVHSCLHLLGYDHETGEEDEKEMFGKQEEILQKIGQER